MKCLICTQSETVDSFTSISFQRGEFRLLINNVPARVCPSCGESYVDEGVALRLLQQAEDVSAQGIMEDVREY